MRDFTIKKYTKLLKALLNRGFFLVSFEMFLEKLMENVIILRHDVDNFPENSLRTARIEHDLGIKGTYYFRSVSGSFDKKIIRQIAHLGHEVGYHYENLSEISKKYKVSSKKGRLENKTNGLNDEVTSRRRKRKAGRLEGENGRLEEKNYWKVERSEIPKAKRCGNGSTIKRKSVDDIPLWVWEKAIENFRVNLEKFRKIYPVKKICMHGSPLSKYDNRLLWEKYDYRDFGIIGSPCEIKYL